eukprot:TRINITY_DN3267_c0_g1_i1.p2 TRINITY_DN3267_c0_g1~~TRINITY_DN3267_c0_g1_i1.p2  ORF type:complete len:295 (+),score=59.51 TRINITY_DN3267_c0_g1_i1:1134-2018(+)
MQPDPNNIPYDKLTLVALSRIGFCNGILIKQGAIVKSWKERYFSLTWNFLSYYEPQEPKIRIANIPLSSCIKATPGQEDVPPYSFNLHCKDRTYIFLTQTKQDRERWLEALDAMIAVNNSRAFPPSSLTGSSPGLPRLSSFGSVMSDVVKKIAFHVLRILHGTALLNNTNINLREKSSTMTSALFALLKNFCAFTLEKEPSPKEKIYQMLMKNCSEVKERVLRIKQEIPSEHRILSEELLFDIGLEERRIAHHLKTLRKVNEEEEEDPRSPFVLEDVEEDVKPFVLNMIKDVLK